MNRWLVLVTLVSFGLVSRPSHAQVVQLPTYRTFSVGTSVLIPDRGSTFLGGVDRGVWNSNTQGVPGLSGVPGVGRLFTNRSISSEVSSSRAYASATIMDLEALDKAVLAEAAAKRALVARGAGHRGATSDSAVERKAAFLAKHIVKTGPKR